jgi:hypothetical protein
MFEYHVDFEPPMESFGARKLILKFHETEGKLSATRNFDGAKLYLPLRLPEKVQYTDFTCCVELDTSMNSCLQKTILTSQNPYNENEAVVTTIKFVKENRMGDCVHFYNILFRRIMEKLGLLEMNRHFFDYRTSHKLPVHRFSGETLWLIKCRGCTL